MDSLEKAGKLAELSSVYSNVGKIDDSAAIRDMATVMKAFNVEAADSITIVDKLGKVGGEYATSVKDLGDGLSHSASAMAASGTNLDKTLAMLAGGTKITKDASAFGDFLTVGSLRVRGMKDDLEELGEEVGTAGDSVRKVQNQVLKLTHGRVNIFDGAGNVKDYYDIMSDISKVYDSLAGNGKADLSELLFGRQHGKQGTAFIEAFQSGQIQSAYEAALSSQGFAMQEQERWMGSMDAKLQQFDAAFQSLSKNMLDSDLLKFFVDLGTNAVSAFDGIIGKLGSLKTLMLGAGLFAGLKNVGMAKP